MQLILERRLTSEKITRGGDGVGGGTDMRTD